MLVYFDESYASKAKLMLGALFIPSNSDKKWLHNSFKELKIKHNFITKDNKLKEIKYNSITTLKKLKIAQETIDLFFNSSDCYFRGCVIPYSEDQLDKIGRQQGIPRKIKEAMLYTHSTVRLIQNNIPGVKNGVLLMDEITRATGDRFNEMVRAKLGSNQNSIFKHIGYVKSSEERNHTIKICDLLLGSVLNEYYPCANGSYKNEFREYVKHKFKIPSLKENYWKTLTKAQADEKHSKFNIRCWGVPYKFSI